MFRRTQRFCSCSLRRATDTCLPGINTWLGYYIVVCRVVMFIKILFPFGIAEKGKEGTLALLLVLNVVGVEPLLDDWLEYRHATRAMPAASCDEAH